MDINNRKALHSRAKQQIEKSSDCPKIALIFAGVLAGASLVSFLLNLLLGWQISKFTGLSGLGMRSVLGTLQTMLPLIFNFLLLAMGLGFTGAMLRVSRGQYTSPKSMKIGCDRFWVLLRATLLQMLLYYMVFILSSNLAALFFLLTPFSNPLVATATVIKEQFGGDVVAAMENSAMFLQLTKDITPLFIIAAIVFLAAAIPIFYHLRLVDYILIDKPGQGAFQSMRESKKLMRGNCLKLFKVDLSMWWYYVVTVLSMILCYGDVILSLLGVEFSMPIELVSILFLAVYLIALFVITVFLEPHVQVVYGLCYDALKPEEPSGGGVVLGNIFNM